MQGVWKMNSIKKIQEFFNSIGCPAKFILKTDREGEEVSNGYGIDFSLPAYAVIHKNEPIIINPEKISKFYKFEKENKMDIIEFSELRCISIDGLIAELGQDGYKIVWRQE
jgi:hypothetical protein